MAAENDRLAELEATCQRLGARIATLDAINRLAASLSQFADIDEVLWDVANGTVAELGLEDCVIYLVDEPAAALVQRAAFGPKNAGGRAIASPIRIPLGQGIVGSVARTGMPERIADTRLDPRYITDDRQRLSELTVPMVYGERIIGVIDSEHSQANFFTEDHQRVFVAIAAITASRVGRSLDYSQLERQRATLEAILDSMADGVFLLSPSGIIHRANDAVGKLLGVRAASLVGRPFHALLARADAAFGSQLATAVKDGPLRARDTIFETEKERITLAVNGSPQLDADGQLVGIVLTARDDRELRRAQAQLQMADRMATMGTLAAGVAHEVNNPLSFILSNLEFAVDELSQLDAGTPLTAELRGEIIKALLASRTGAERVRGIVRDLKAFSRVDEETVTRVDVNHLLDSALSMLRNEIRHRARVVKRYGQPPPVKANEARAMQVVLNLLQNAAQAIPVGATQKNEIRVRTGEDERGHAVVEIEDTGSGIPEEHLAHIFDAFFTTKPLGVGTGLGLSICQRLVSQMGGLITVTSVVGQGSTFTVTLPPALDLVDAPPRSSARSGSGGERLRILVLDDEPEIGSAVRRVLADHDVVSVVRGDEALRLLERESFDLVLCDLMMPEMDGVTFHETWRRTLPEVRTPVVFMSGVVIHQGTASPFASVPGPSIDKPFDPQALRDLVAAVGRRRATDQLDP